MKRFQLLCTCVTWLSLTLTAQAQTANHNRDFDPLHQFNSAVRKLVSQVTPSVDQTRSVARVKQTYFFSARGRVAEPNQSRVSQLGVVVIDIDSAIAQKLSALRMASGVLVAARAIDSTADVALEAGDVIHTINGASVKTSEELRSTLNRTVVLQIERSGKLMFIAFKLDEAGR